MSEQPGTGPVRYPRVDTSDKDKEIKEVSEKLKGLEAELQQLKSSGGNQTALDGLKCKIEELKRSIESKESDISELKDQKNACSKQVQGLRG